jgi:hypothetical protein
MKITVAASHDVSVACGGQSQRASVPAKHPGRGSAVNGGEFLRLALATGYCRADRAVTAQDRCAGRGRTTPCARALR